MKKVFLSLFLLVSVPAWAGFTEAINYFDNQQYAQSFAEFKPLADKGDERAQYYVAYMYLNGLGVIQNTQNGVDYLNRSKDQEYEKALSLLGYLHSIGKFVELDKKKALDFYLKAAELEDNDALLNLGVMYYTADGVKQDTDKAIEYFQRVDLVSNPVVGRYLADIYQYQSDVKLRKKAKELYMLAASNGDLGAFHSLASIFHQGKDEPQDFEKAIQYYTYAASQGYAMSQYALGILYANGSGIEKNIETAYAWITLAANQGFLQAIEAQKQLEELFTFSELNLARNKVSKIEQDIIGKIESPLKDYTLKNTTIEAEKSKKRPQSRRRPMGVRRARK